MGMKKIIEVNVNKKKFDVSLVKNTTTYNIWFCVYVKLGKIKGDGTVELSCCTFHEDTTYGIDTAHLHNEHMSIQEKEKDAIKQIRRLIKPYLEGYSNDNSRN